MKAQAAFEYMLVVIIVLGFLVPLWTYTLSMHNEASDELTLSYAKSAVETLTSAADLVYTQGAPAKVKVSVFVPDGVELANITNRTVILKVAYTGGTTGILSTSRARLNGTVPTRRGTYWMEVRAVDNANFDVDIQKA
jgi:uncharacterized protein (UPF0333 family)